MKTPNSREACETSQEKNNQKIKKETLTLFADRTGGRWVVLDSGGNFWELAAGDRPWEHRRLCHLSGDTDLNLVPAHYKQLLGLPF